VQSLASTSFSRCQRAHRGFSLRSWCPVRRPA